MCSPATCRTCGLATWTGCGNHVDQALAGVPAHRRCQCDAKSGSNDGSFGSLFGKIFSR